MTVNGHTSSEKYHFPFQFFPNSKQDRDLLKQLEFLPSLVVIFK